MYRILLPLIVLLTFNYYGDCQIMPKEGSEVNYRIIGFTFPDTKISSEYVLEIAEGKYLDNLQFKKNVSQRIAGNNNRIIATVGHFGKEYTWRIRYGKGSAITRGELHHFRVGNIAETDTGKIRVRVVKQSQKSKDKYFFVDGTNILYDHNGLPVWYLPAINSEQIYGSDLKITDDGTITFLSNDAAYEIDYDGNVLWKSAKGKDKTVCVYHHDLSKLHNGHYMALGSSCPQSGDNAVKETNINPAGKRFFNNEQSGKLAELDDKGRVIWIWEIADYIAGSDLYHVNKLNDSSSLDMHENSFSFNEKDSTIYLSFSGISRIVKIKYPSGKVVGTYGNLYNPEQNKAARLSQKEVTAIHKQLADNNSFRGQHSCRLAKDGGLYVYNNNVLPPQLSPDAYIKRSPQIVKLVEKGKPDEISIVWSYNCIADDEVQNMSGGGGNVTELSDGSIYVSTNPPYCKLLLLNTDKIIEWSAVVEKKQENGWSCMPSYRSSIVESNMAMERMIWYNADNNSAKNTKNTSPGSNQIYFTK